MITIYGIQSGNVARLRASLLQKNLPFQHVSVKLRQKSEEFKRLTVAETIPVLQDGEVIIGDSIAAMVYLDEAYPKTYQMLGNSPAEKAKILSLIWAMDRIGKDVTPLYLESMATQLRAAGASHRAVVYDAQQKEDLQKDVSYRLDKLLHAKSGQYFLAQYSAADAAMLALLGTLLYNKLKIGKWQGWQEQMIKEFGTIFAPQEEKGVREI